MFKIIIIAADTKHWCRHKALSQTKGLTETLTRWGKREAQWRRRKTACHLQGTTTKPYTKWTTQHMSNGICIIIIIYIYIVYVVLFGHFIHTHLFVNQHQIVDVQQIRPPALSAVLCRFNLFWPHWTITQICGQASVDHQYHHIHGS